MWETQDRANPQHIFRKDFIMVDEQYCAVDHHLQARLTRWTKVKEIVPVPQGFPLFAYKLRSFQQILSSLDDTTCLAGEVQIVHSKGQPKARRHIGLNDGRDEATLALWENKAHEFEAEYLYNTSKRHPIVAIFAGCTFKIHDGKLSLSASYAYKQYIDIPNKDIATFQDRLAGTTYEIQWTSTGPGTSTQNKPTETTLAELSFLNLYKIMNHRYICRATIKGLAPNDKWWYLACTACKKKLYRMAIATDAPNVLAKLHSPDIS